MRTRAFDIVFFIGAAILPLHIVRAQAGPLPTKTDTVMELGNRTPRHGMFRLGAPILLETKLGLGVVHKEVVGEDSIFYQHQKVYLWMKVSRDSFDTLSVKWKHNGLSQINLVPIGGSPWRTWVYKTVTATGRWTITITSETGHLLKEINFTVGQPTGNTIPQGSTGGGTGQTGPEHQP